MIKHLLLFSALTLTTVLNAQFADPKPAGPLALRPRGHQSLLLKLQGKGSQIYVCQNPAGGGPPAWRLKAPDAKLYRASGELVGRHFAGPTWEFTDGSQVVGKLVKSLPSPEKESIPWLLLTAASHTGNGAFSRVQSIQRLATKGGIAPDTGCTSSNLNAETPVSYEATYYFYGQGFGAMHVQ